MKIVPLLLVCLSGLLLCGCVSTYHFTPYVGEQQNWKTASGCFMETNGALPVYYGLPPKPYNVIGMMICNANSLGMASRDARAHGGEAMVLTDEKTMQRGSVSIGGGSSTYASGSYGYGNFNGSSHTFASPSYNVPVSNTFETFAVIKFKPQP